MQLTRRMTALTVAAVSATLLLAGCTSAGSSSGEAPASLAAAGASVASGSEADVTFAQLMIPHHEQAVQMADLALEQASSPAVIDLATQIKAAQDPEIQQMRGWLQQWGAPEQMDGAHGMNHGDMDMGGFSADGMMSDDDMNALMDASGTDFDRMWLTMMVAHHEGAIAMADQVKAQSTNADVTALADAVITGQTSEIATMQKLLEQSSPSASNSVDGSGLPGHVHNLAFDGPTLLVGTHEGLWSQAPGQAPRQVSQRAFDVMGFTRAESRWLASGHPGHDEDGPADLGLVQSTDRGSTWEPVSLAGEVDFHRLVAAGDRIFGIASADNALLRSDDAGRTWTTLGTAPLFDIAVSPTDADILIGTTEQGPVRSTDAGATFASLPAPSLIALLAWTGDQLVGVDTDGQVLTSTDAGDTWQEMATLPEQAMALAADGSRIAALAGGTIYESTDGGKAFTERITGIARN